MQEYRRQQGSSGSNKLWTFGKPQQTSTDFERAFSSSRLPESILPVVSPSSQPTTHFDTKKVGQLCDELEKGLEGLYEKGAYYMHPSSGTRPANSYKELETNAGSNIDRTLGEIEKMIKEQILWQMPQSQKDSLKITSRFLRHLVDERHIDPSLANRIESIQNQRLRFSDKALEASIRKPAAETLASFGSISQSSGSGITNLHKSGINRRM
jgi:hypothetical protein